MASPVDAARATTNITSSAGTHVINLPGSIAAGDLLVMYLRSASTLVLTTPPTDWVKLIDADNSDASDDTTWILYKWATGSEGATVSVVYDAGSARGCAICWRITGAENPSTQPPETSTVAVGTTTANTANPTTVTPTGGSKDYLFLAVASQDGEAGAYTASPTNYSTISAANSGTFQGTTTNVQMGGGSRQLTAASEDPGAFTHAAAVTGWSAFAVAIHPPGAPAAPVPRYGFVDHANPGVLMKGLRRAWHRRRSGIFVPELWLPESV